MYQELHIGGVSRHEGGVLKENRHLSLCKCYKLFADCTKSPHYLSDCYKPFADCSKSSYSLSDCYKPIADCSKSPQSLSGFYNPFTDCYQPFSACSFPSLAGGLGFSPLSTFLWLRVWGVTALNLSLAEGLRFDCSNLLSD